MSIKQQLDVDLKTAMLGGDKILATTLRGLKSAVLNIEIAEGKREQGLDDQAIVGLFQKEAKKRQESADLYIQGGNKEKAELELVEKQVIEKYLPAQITDEELADIIGSSISAVGATSMQDMGKVIGLVKSKTEGRADGGRIANAVKERLSS
jgi:uncharacterized protein YqeY